MVGAGSASTGSRVALLPAPTASDHHLQRARAEAVADGRELLDLVPCPRCGKRGDEQWSRYNRWTRVWQGLVAVGFAVLVVVVWTQNPDNPAVGVLCAVPGAMAVFLVGYLRGLRAEVPADRVTFLSPEDIAAEQSREAQRAAKEAAAEAHRAAEEATAERRRAEARSARTDRRRGRGRPSSGKLES